MENVLKESLQFSFCQSGSRWSHISESFRCSFQKNTTYQTSSYYWARNRKCAAIHARCYTHWRNHSPLMAQETLYPISIWNIMLWTSEDVSQLHQSQYTGLTVFPWYKMRFTMEAVLTLHVENQDAVTHFKRGSMLYLPTLMLASLYLL